VFAVKLDSVLACIRDQVCPPGPPNTAGEYDGITFALHLRFSADEVAVEARAFILVYGQTTVCTAVTQNLGSWQSAIDVPLDHWLSFVSPDHWRSMGHLTSLYGGMLHLLNEKQAVDGRSTPVGQWSDDSTLGDTFLRPWELVTVTARDDPKDLEKRIITKLVRRGS
jgi:hypothetical protein